MNRFAPSVFVFPNGERRKIVTDGSPVCRVRLPRQVSPLVQSEDDILGDGTYDELVFVRIAFRHGSGERAVYVAADLSDQQKLDAIIDGVDEP